jgi:hypothetical protein
VVAQNAVNSQASNPANRANPAQPSLTSLNPLSATASVKADDSLVALAAFSNWAEQFLSNSPSASVARGEALAWKRREAMLELIETNPEKALAQAAPFGWRSTLPANVTRYFEQWVDGRGALNVTVATDFERGHVTVQREVQIGGKNYQAFVYGRRARQASQTQIPLHGIALDGKMAVQTDPVRLLASDEAAALEKERGQPMDKICGVSGRPADYRHQLVNADVGGEIKYFCGVDHARLVNQRLILAEAGGSGTSAALATAANDAWTHGPKTVLYLRVNFPDDLTEPISEAGAYDVMDGVNDFYTEGSYDLTSLSPTVTPLMTLPETKGWYSTAGPGALLTAARAAARKAGYETANYDLDIVCHTAVPDFDWGGLAAVHGKALWLQSPGVGVTCHELGHNYGLWHANFWDTTNTFSIVGTGTNLEYGNIYDTMGRAGAGKYQFNATHKNILDWLPDSTVHNVTSNGVYRIFPFDVPSRVNGRFYAARVNKDFRRDYWIEFRQKFTDNAWLQNGVLLDWAPWDESNGGTQLLDTTPGTPTADNSREDAALVIGRTFSDTAENVYITPLARGDTGTNVWMDVQINLGASPTNHSPTVQIEIDPPSPAPGELVHFHATASDPDGDSLAYAWTFDDFSFSTNNLPWTTKSWDASSDRVIRCVVSDMKGGVASANAVVTVGEPAGYRITGRVVDTNGVPLEGVRVDTGSANLTNYFGGYTDSDGAYVIVNATGDITLNAFKYGFTFMNAGWINPLSVTNDMANIDFVAISMPTMSLTASTNVILENSSDTQYFTLSHTGDTNTDFIVKLYLSGSANVSSDFILAPALTNGFNIIDIPPGTQSVSFVFQTVNDSSIEGPETATLTILEDPTYVVSSGEATITILDDDSPSQPAVSVAAVTPTVPENGMDSGTFLFSRTGSTQNDLTVFYSAGGTATPGTDYSSLVGVVVIPGGSATATVRFQTIDDKAVESNETVVVTVAPNAAYTVSGSSAQVTITDDDLLTVTIFPTDSGAAEPSTSGRFTVKREGDLTGNLVVNYNASGIASNGIDYVSLSGSVTIAAGAASADIVLTPLDDNLIEGDESVILTLATNVAYNIGTPGVATIFIRDNEKVSVSITAPDAMASEPGDDTGQFLISRGSVTSGNLTVNLALSGTATPGVDYLPLDNPVVIPDGASSVTLDVIVFDDLHVEPTEDIILTILSSTNYNIGSPGQATVQITDDDANSVPAVGFTFSTSSAEENKSPGISVSLSSTSSVPITVDYRIIGGTASNNDYTLPAGPLTFAPGERAKSIPLTIINDTTVEPNETIRLVLFNPTGATLDGIKIHTYTIIDDDTASVSVTNTAPGASEAGAVGNFRILRSGATNAPLQVNFQVTGTASAPADYAPLGTSVTIPAAVTFVDLPVIPVDDQTVEHGETVVMTLLTAPGAKIVSPNVATVNITDNDTNTLPVITITSTNHPYAVEGGGSGEFLFTRDGTNGTLTLYFTIAGTATSGVDFVTLTNVVTIPDGQTSVTLPVIPIDDALVEGEETVVASLTIRDTYRVAYPSAAAVTIQDNDQRVRLDASDFTASEPGTNTGEFTFTRFGTTNTALEIFFTISGTASNGIDYVAISSPFTIPAGSLSATLPILPVDDVLVEGPETVTLTLQTNSAYSLDRPNSGSVTIQDDEPMLTLTATMTNIIEGSLPPAAFRITRTGDPKYDFTALLAVGGTAAYGVDYPPFLTNVYFSPGVMAIDLLISPTNELVTEGVETVTAMLLPDPIYTILSPSNAVITIEDAGTNNMPLVIITSPTANMVFFLNSTNVGIILEATVTNESDTNAPLTLTWTNVSGPNSLIFGATDQANTTVILTNAGIYVLRLTADDGQLQGFAEVTVVVGAVELLSTNLLHWAFDEGSGASVLDTSGAGRDGILVGAPIWQTNGVLGGALSFGGAGDYVRQSSGTNFLNGLKEFSLSFWINSATTNNDQGIFSAADSDTNTTLALYTKTQASSGLSTNVIEATIPTTAGMVRYISSSGVLTNGWQHLVLTWSNGLAPALFINGQLDQPFSYFVTLSGVLTNCGQFNVGKGPVGGPGSWNGMMDDVRVFSRALSAAEIRALAALPPTNYGAVVDAGPDVTFQINVPAALVGTVTDDGKPNPPGAFSNTWVLISGPADVTMTSTNSLTNSVQFTQAGDYVFRLVADDGQVKVFDDVTAKVIEPTRIDVYASDSEAAELGPDTGQFTFTRSGDTNEMTIFLTLSGTASNGVDYIELTNTVTFPAEIDTVSIDVTPFLDPRIEGDETVTFTIVTNAAYTVGNASATVTIHDSPYGVWSVQHFSLEELTRPELSSETADFENDGWINFVEYAANFDPKSPDANPPVTTAIELDPTNSLPYITLTYHRRLPPTDAAYAPSVSNDLFIWNTGTNYIEEIQTTDDGNRLTETVKARVKAPYSTSTNYFIAVRVWLLTTGP